MITPWLSIDFPEIFLILLPQRDTANKSPRNGTKCPMRCRENFGCKVRAFWYLSFGRVVWIWGYCSIPLICSNPRLWVLGFLNECSKESDLSISPTRNLKEGWGREWRGHWGVLCPVSYSFHRICSWPSLSFPRPLGMVLPTELRFVGTLSLLFFRLNEFKLRTGY